METLTNNRLDGERRIGWHAQSLRWAWRSRCSRHHALRGLRACHPTTHRHGKVTLVTLFAILGMVVLAGFVGNSGHVVTKKVETQNAADAVAFSAAQWMARGMNAITATNHLIGEMTGLVVVLEALGGPEADLKLEDYPLESKSVDKINRQLRGYAPMKGGYGASALGKVDSKFVEFVVDLVSPESEQKAKHKAFATVYDSKMVLKRDLRTRLLIKTVANVGFMVPPPFGYATAIAAYAAHAHSNYEIAIIAKEWIILEGLEFVARSIKLIKVDILEKLLIPKLAEHGDFVAGKSLGSNPVTTGVVNAGIADSLEHIGDVYGVEADIFPGATKWNLPIETEPEPSLIGSRGNNEPEWSSDDPPADSTDDLLSDLRENIEDQQDEIRYRIYQIKLSITGTPGAIPPNGLNYMESEMEDLLEDAHVDDRSAISDELSQIRALRAKKEARIRELEEEIRKLDREVANMEKIVAESANMDKTPGNLSIKHIPQDRMNQAEERYTQWVRATYPYVDSFRAPILAQFEKHLEKSEAAKHYRKWTDRYTLVKAWQFRSGFRFEGAAGGKTGQWVKKPNVDPLKMYVMQGAFQKTGPRRDRKGHETWTLDTAAGKQEAEKIYTVIGTAHREIEPLFSPVVYPLASEGGILTFAQAIFYNGNEQQPAPVGAKQKTQAKLGWDTLNWDPAAATPEWGAEPSRSKAKWPWEIFTSNPDQVGTARVKLNWQAKLMPVTQSRLIEATAANVLKPEIAQSLGKAAGLYDKMVTH